MIVGVPQESFTGEQRVALTPAVVPGLTKAGVEVGIETGAGVAAGYPNAAYEAKGASIVGSRDELFKTADVVLQVRAAGANLETGAADTTRLRSGQIVIGLCEPLAEVQISQQLAVKSVTLCSMELMPRITRAQSMDVLSSMASIAGYKAVLLAAEALPKMFPMMMTAAGTIKPARTFVIGVGVAGLQAIATAKRLGAVVDAYDVRPAVKEQVESLGAKFVEMELDAGDSEDKGGYAKAMGEEFYRKQRELMTRVVAEMDVVITTAAIPGKKSPILVTEDMVKGMSPGSVIVDMAAERGGNVELTQAGKTIEAHGVTIMGPTNLPSTVPYHASQMYAKNISTYLLHLLKEGAVVLDMEDEITRETVVCRDGAIVHPRVAEILGINVEKPEGASD
jgi:NAD(P) transhydrogenase subunit alpha